MSTPAYSDDASAHEGVVNGHESVKHSGQEYVRGDVHTNGIESFWPILKRGHYGTYHKMSPQHLDRHVTEFAGRHNMRKMNTIDQMTDVIAGMTGKRLTYKRLIADYGGSSGARSRSTLDWCGAASSKLIQ